MAIIQRAIVGIHSRKLRSCEFLLAGDVRLSIIVGIPPSQRVHWKLEQGTDSYDPPPAWVTIVPDEFPRYWLTRALEERLSGMNPLELELQLVEAQEAAQAFADALLHDDEPGAACLELGVGAPFPVRFVD